MIPRSMNSLDLRTKLELQFTLLQMRMEFCVALDYLQRILEASRWKGWPNTTRRAYRRDKSI